jgi:hypothetical protein
MIDIAFRAWFLFSTDVSKFHAKVHEKQSNAIIETQARLNQKMPNAPIVIDIIEPVILRAFP